MSSSSHQIKVCLDRTSHQVAFLVKSQLILPRPVVDFLGVPSLQEAYSEVNLLRHSKNRLQLRFLSKVACLVKRPLRHQLQVASLATRQVKHLHLGDYLAIKRVKHLHLEDYLVTKSPMLPLKGVYLGTHPPPQDKEALSLETKDHLHQAEAYSVPQLKAVVYSANQSQHQVVVFSPPSLLKEVFSKIILTACSETLQATFLQKKMRALKMMIVRLTTPQMLTNHQL